MGPRRGTPTTTGADRSKQYQKNIKRLKKLMIIILSYGVRAGMGTRDGTGPPMYRFSSVSFRK